MCRSHWSLSSRDRGRIRPSTIRTVPWVSSPLAPHSPFLNSLSRPPRSFPHPCVFSRFQQREHHGTSQYFNIVMALAQCRFASEKKDDALEKLSRMLRPAQPGPGPDPHAQKREVQLLPKYDKTKLTKGFARRCSLFSRNGHSTVYRYD